MLTRLPSLESIASPAPCRATCLPGWDVSSSLSSRLPELDEMSIRVKQEG
jgi:hypothetical protein